MKSRYDIIVIGAGPAGMTAASLAAEHGASVALLDEQSGLGGQIYRSVTCQGASDPSILGAEYYQGKTLADRLDKSTADHVKGASVWQISEDREVGVTVDGAACLVSADQWPVRRSHTGAHAITEAAVIVRSGRSRRWNLYLFSLEGYRVVLRG